MWNIKHFKDRDAAQAWIDANDHRYQCERVFIENKPVSIQYRKLVSIRMAR